MTNCRQHTEGRYRMLFVTIPKFPKQQQQQFVVCSGKKAKRTWYLREKCTVPMNTEKCTHLTIRHGWRFGSNDGAIQPKCKPPATELNRERATERVRMKWSLIYWISFENSRCACAHFCPLFSTTKLSLTSHLLHSHFVSFEIRHAHFFLLTHCSVRRKCCEVLWKPWKF